MHSDSPTPPKDEARGDRTASGKPSVATWQHLDEGLPQWDSWSKLAEGPPPRPVGDDSLGGGARPSRRPPAIKAFRLSDGPSAGDFADAHGSEPEPSERAGLPEPQRSTERHNHRPLFSPRDELSAPPSGVSLIDGAASTSDDIRDAGNATRHDARRDDHGYGYLRQEPSGDDHGHAAVKADGLTPLEGDGSPGVEGDDYRNPATQGDGNSHIARGDGFAPPGVHGDGFENPIPRADGFVNPAARGDGFGEPEEERITILGDGFDSGAIHGEGFGGAAAEGGDGFSGPAANSDGDGFSGAAPIGDGDGFAGSAPKGDGFTHAGENDESPEPWNDLSQFPHVKTSTAATTSDEEDDADDGFSALDLRDRVVIMLLFKQVVQIDEVERAHRRWQKESGGKSKEPLWRVLTMDSAFDRDTIFAEAAQVYAFKQATLDKKAAAAFIKKHKDTFAETFWERMTKLRVLPICHETHAQKKEKHIIFVSHDPSRPDVNRLMRELKLDNFELQYAPEAEIEALIHEAFPKRNEYLDRVSDNEFAFDLGTSYDQSSSLIDEDALEAEISRSSLINLFEASLVEAVRRGVSDIHIFPNPRKQIEIHFRVDGELECWHREERVHPEAFLAVVKDNTLNVDRFERDTAQDGFIQRKVDDTLIRYRVSVLPVANANQEIRSESIVIRVLDDRKVITDLSKLGLLDQARAKFEWAIRQPHGMVILTGPTGSGKTTTLFAALHQVVTEKVNVLTVEDPVEYVIPSVRQIKLSHKLALEQALRSILRHDPDIVMVGEMRDRETAELAIKLANTGHLTFSTLHTNDAPSAVSRLYKMGVEPFLIAYAINLVVAQRLLRTLCTKCKRPARSIDQEMLQRLGFTPQELAHARFYDEGHDPNCQACGGTGYKGRRAITETMAFTDEIRRKIVMSNEMIDEDGLRQQAVADGMLTLRGSAREIVKQGDSSVAELIRVTAGEH